MSLRSITIYDYVDSMMFKQLGRPWQSLLRKKNLHIILNNNRGVARCGTWTKSYYAHQNINYSRHRVFFYTVFYYWVFGRFLLQIVFFMFLPYKSHRGFFTVFGPKISGSGTVDSGVF